MYSCNVELSSKIEDLKVLESVSQKLLAMYSMCDLTGATFTTKLSMRSSELFEWLQSYLKSKELNSTYFWIFAIF